MSDIVVIVEEIDVISAKTNAWNPEDVPNPAEGSVLVYKTDTDKWTAVGVEDGNGVDVSQLPTVLKIAGRAWVKKTANYTASNYDMIIADTSAGSFTVTLPASPTIGYSVRVADGNNWNTHNLTINRNGATINGLSQNLTLAARGVSVELLYDGTTWKVFELAGPAAATGGGSDKVFFENDTTISSDYTITSGKNAMTAGPISITSGHTVTVPDGSTWTVI